MGMIEASRMVMTASTEDLRSEADEPLNDVSWQPVERSPGPAQRVHPPSAATDEESASSSCGRPAAEGFLNVQDASAETSGSESDAPRVVRAVTIRIDTSGSESEVPTLRAPAEPGIDLLNVPAVNEQNASETDIPVQAQRFMD